LNIGPDAHGTIPEESLKVLEEVGLWMEKNHKSIYDCDYAGIEKPENGRITRNGAKLYYHIFENTFGPMPIRGIGKDQIKSIRSLSTGHEIPISTSWVHSDYPNIVFADLGPDPVLPDPVDTVLEIELQSE
jgi:alpha-L-fucosidase